MMATQTGKLLYISDNAAEYLGHSMVRKKTFITITIIITIICMYSCQCCRIFKKVHDLKMQFDQNRDCWSYLKVSKSQQKIISLPSFRNHRKKKNWLQLNRDNVVLLILILAILDIMHLYISTCMHALGCPLRSLLKRKT